MIVLFLYTGVVAVWYYEIERLFKKCVRFEWLEQYYAFSPEEKLAISSIPSDLYELRGYGEAEDTVANGPTE